MPTARACLPESPHPVTSDRLHCVIGAFGAVQIVAGRGQVLLDLQARSYTTAGHLAEDHATARLPLDDAERLVARLAAAVVQARALAISHAPTWSPETAGHVALTSSRRRHPNRRAA